MSEKISDYVADATSNPIKNEDYLDFSNEDGIGGYDVSKKILVSELLAFIGAGNNIYNIDGTLLTDRIVTSNTFFTQFSGGDVECKMSDEINNYAFIVKDSGDVKLAILGYDQPSNSAEFQLHDGNGLFLNAINKKLNLLGATSLNLETGGIVWATGLNTGTLNHQAFSLTRTWDLPDKSGVIALVEDGFVGNSLFVSSDGDTIANGAIRESFLTHFSSMSEAKSVALAGDTIYVYGDQTPNTNLYKDGVIWEFMGNPTITNNQRLFDDGGVAGTCTVRGNANFISSTSAFYFTGVGSILNLECESVLSTSSPTFQLVGTIANINANGNLHTNTGATFYIDGVSDIKVTARTITSGNLCLNVAGAGASGTVIINADYISSTSGANGSVLYAQNSVTEVDIDIIINVTDRIFHAGAVNTCMAVRPDSGRWVINGNIDGGVGVAIKDFTPSTGRVFTHNGNATNDGQNPVVLLTDNSDTDCVTYLNGTYTGANAITIHQDNTLNTLFINGRIENTNALAVAKSGIFITDATATIIQDLVIILDGAIGTPTMIDALVATKFYKNQRHLGSNFGQSFNVGNLIGGNVPVIDTDYQ